MKVVSERTFKKNIVTYLTWQKDHQGIVITGGKDKMPKWVLITAEEYDRLRGLK